MTHDSKVDVGTEAVRLELDRIVSSKTFSGAKRSQTFLRYVVERSLLSTAPKEFEIALEVFGRGADYDPEIDATVRVEASRLRSRLREYYDTAGMDDTILIDIPKGGYGAVFVSRRATVASDAAMEDPRPGRPTTNDTADSQEANVQFVLSDAVGALSSSGDAAQRMRLPSTKGSARWRVGAVIAATGIACLLALIALRMAWRKPQSAGPIRSIAVLPLQNLSGDPNQEYFADGMTDELITELARIPNLRVVSRTSVMRDKGSGKSLSQIAQELRVDAIIEGSVVRANDRVRITTQLIDARDDKHLWAQSFEGQLSDVLSLQDGVAREIASQTKTALAPSVQSQLASPKHVNPEAHDAYLRGRFFVERRDGKTAATYFRKAISLDSEYAAAHAGLAEALITMHEAGGSPVNEVIPDAIASAKRAIELDPNEGEGYTALGTIDTVVLWDWDAAEQNLRRGIELNPNSALAEIRYANYLIVRARTEEAIAHMRKAVEVDPAIIFCKPATGERALSRPALRRSTGSASARQ